MIANGGSLRRSAKKLGIDQMTLWGMINRNPEHHALYARARACRAQYHESKIGGAAKTLQQISESNLDDDIRIRAISSEVKARQWLAKVSDPHMFGDKQIIEGGGKPLQIEHSLSPNEHARRIAFMLTQAAVQQSKPGA